MEVRQQKWARLHALKVPTLKEATNRLEDGIITLSGPALAISGVIAGIDLVTGGHLLQQYAWFTLAWAICLLLTLDFQVLALGARVHHIYLGNTSSTRKVCEIALCLIIAVAISFVSVQMQSIIARVNGVANLSIDQAASQLGINLIWLIWERSALVLILIFMSGWFREEKDAGQNTETQNTATDEAIKHLAEQVTVLTASMHQITTTVTEVKTSVTQITAASLPALSMPTEHREDTVESGLIGQRTPGQNTQETSKKEQIRQYLTANPGASLSSIMNHANVARSYASATRSQIHKEQEKKG